MHVSLIFVDALKNLSDFEQLGHRFALTFSQLRQIRRQTNRLSLVENRLALFNGPIAVRYSLIRFRPRASLSKGHHKYGEDKRRQNHEFHGASIRPVRMRIEFKCRWVAADIRHENLASSRSVSSLFEENSVAVLGIVIALEPNRCLHESFLN